MAEEPRVTVTRHTGTDFERGRVGHRNGQPMLEHDVTDGTRPEEERPTTGLHHQPALLSGGQRARQAPARRAVPAREGDVWATVRVHPDPANLMNLQPKVDCLTCGKKGFSVNLTRIVAHITGSGGVAPCQPAQPTEQWLALKKRLVNEMSSKASSKAAKRTIAEVNAAAQAGLLSPATGTTQRPIKPALGVITAEICDDAVADFFYGDNISDSIVESPRFKNLCQKLKCAPADWEPPNRDRLGNDLLLSTTARLLNDMTPLKEAILEHCGTVVSDGWDDVERNHLINFLYGTTKGMFFDGTVELTSEQHEDAQAVADMICDFIARVGKYTIIQVVTDTCSVMKAAWRIIEARYPWITCTCCGPHVISLEIKDISQIPEVARVIANTQKIINRFRGRTRWPRNRLREVVLRNQGKNMGLYRAKDTRFAGKVKEMARVLRLKLDLQEVVGSADYAKQKFKDDAASGTDDVKAIVQDELGYWAELLDALRILTPLVVLLRMMDSDKPVMGKVYDKMFMVGARLEKSTVSYAARAAAIHATRWEYLHSVMHAAGYALDPEFLSTQGDLDSATQEGLFKVMNRIALRDLLECAKSDDERAMLSLDSKPVQEHLAKLQMQLMRYQRKEGTFSMLSVQINAKTLAPAEWWHMYGKHLPELCSVAKRVLAQPVCASAAERNWSVYGQIKAAGSSRRNHSNADKRVFCHETLRMKVKLQSAGYTQAVEAWDPMDSDSDESDEEDYTKLMQ